MKLAMYFVIGLFLAACQSRDHVKLIYPDKIYNHTAWTEDELKKDIAIRHFHRGTNSSTHLVRIKGKESPNFHDRHDLTVSVISGTAVIHFKNHGVSLLPGDVIYIPKGTFHLAENTDPVANVAFVVFSPAFDGKCQVSSDYIPRRSYQFVASERGITAACGRGSGRKREDSRGVGWQCFG